MLDASSILSGYGLAGLVIAALTAATVKLYLTNQKIQKDWRDSLEASNKKLEQSNERHQTLVGKLSTLVDRTADSVAPPSQ